MLCSPHTLIRVMYPVPAVIVPAVIVPPADRNKGRPSEAEASAECRGEGVSRFLRPVYPYRMFITARFGLYDSGSGGILPDRQCFMDNFRSISQPSLVGIVT
jgi:hypothetical protein